MYTTRMKLWNHCALCDEWRQETLQISITVAGKTGGSFGHPHCQQAAREVWWSRANGGDNCVMRGGKKPCRSRSQWQEKLAAALVTLTASRLLERFGDLEQMGGTTVWWEEARNLADLDHSGRKNWRQLWSLLVTVSRLLASCHAHLLVFFLY